MLERQKCLSGVFRWQKNFYQVGKEGCLCLDNEPEKWYIMQWWWGSAASRLADRRRGMAEHEGLYNHYELRKSVTQFFPISVSLIDGVHNVCWTI